MAGKCGISVSIYGDSSVLHRTSCIVQKIHVIREMSARSFSERGVTFQSMDQVKRYNGLKLFNERSNL